MTVPTYLIHYNRPEWAMSASATLGANVTIVNTGRQRIMGPAGKVIDLPPHAGYTGGANAAITRWLSTTDEPFVLVTAHDCHAEPGALDALLMAAVEHSAFGVLTFDFTDAETGNTGIGAELSAGPVSEREWVSGTALLLRREMVEQIGLLDESFGSYVEDVEYCLRARKAGWKVGTVIGAEAHGLGSALPSRASRRIAANWVLLCLKTDDVEGARWRFRDQVRGLLRSVKYRSGRDFLHSVAVLGLMARQVGRWLLAGRPRAAVWR